MIQIEKKKPAMPELNKESGPNREVGGDRRGNPFIPRSKERCGLRNMPDKMGWGRKVRVSLSRKKRKKVRVEHMKSYMGGKKKAGVKPPPSKTAQAKRQNTRGETSLSKKHRRLTFAHVNGRQRNRRIDEDRR